MKKNFLNPEIKISIFNTENLITASGGTEPTSLQSYMESDENINGGVTSMSFADLQSKLQ
ncbi:MAG: hypothetical protein ACLRQ0_02010 [Monoglobales bacterium]